MKITVPNTFGLVEPWSMAWEEDGLYQASATASHGAFYTVTDYSGAGVLLFCGQYQATAGIYAYMKLTLDGNAKTFDPDEVNVACAYIAGGPSPTNTVVHGPLHFRTSCKFEIANDEGSAKNIAGWASYGILSEEIERRIIPAGDSLPDRDYTYDQDVMAVFFRSIDRITSKIEFLSSPHVQLATAVDGTVTGKLVEPIFGPVGIAGKDYDPQGPRRILRTKVEDREELIQLAGQAYKVSIVKGILENSNLPKVAPSAVVDATAAKVG